MKYNNELYHYGIDGQKWGIRRFQYEDDSLTPAGRIRYGVGPPRSKKRIDIVKNTKNYSRRNDTRKVTKNNDITSKEATEYRSKMISKYRNSDSEKYEKYSKMSEKDIKDEIVRRENVKKALIIGAAAVGIGTAGYLAYKYDVIGQLNAKLKTGKVTNKDVKQAFDNALDDFSDAANNFTSAKNIASSVANSRASIKPTITSAEDAYTFGKGFTFHRQVGFENFDLTKVKNNALYVSATKEDTAAYKLFLNDFANTGKRYDVALKANKDIKIIKDAAAEKLFDEFIKNNNSYKEKFIEESARFYAKANNNGKDVFDTLSKNEQEKWKHYAELASNVRGSFNEAMTIMPQQGSATKDLIGFFKQKGYDGMIDVHDLDVFTKMPIILFNADTDVVKTGETLVTKSAALKAAKFISTSRPEKFAADVYQTAKSIVEDSNFRKNFFKISPFKE